MLFDRDMAALSCSLERMERTMSTEIDSLLTSSPEIRDGRPCIAGTGISVHRTAIRHNLCHRPEDIKAADLYLSKYSQTYSETGLAQSKLWKPGTLCITIAANIAETAILAIEGCFPDSVVGFVANPMKADGRFIKYAIDLMKLSM